MVSKYYSKIIERRKIRSEFTDHQEATYLILLGYTADQIRQIAYYNYLWDNEDYVSKSDIIHLIIEKIKDNVVLNIPDNIEKLRHKNGRRNIVFWRNPKQTTPEQGSL